jgi:hypothetical protein
MSTRPSCGFLRRPLKEESVTKKAAAYQAGMDAADRLMDKLEPLLRAWPLMNEEEKREIINTVREMNLGRTTRQ